jgi:hypothetical protein
MTRTLTALLLSAGLLLTACGEEDSKIPEDTGTPVIDEDGDGYDADSDCDDDDPAVHPGATEVCDEVDNDCDGEVDEDVAAPWYPDLDGDGYGDDANVIDSCDEPSGYVDIGGDCDDGDAASHPGADETCDGADNDCDGEIDEDPLDVWYADTDGDGWGTSDYSAHVCDPGSGWVQDGTDCDDNDADVHPEAAERCNERDDDCDGEVDEELATTWYLDGDGDGYGDAARTTDDCDPGDGWVADATDCDDSDAGIHPAEGEHCDGFDNDCDGLVDDADPDIDDQQTWYFDGDGDGYGVGSSVHACFQPSGYAAAAGDCDDGDASINPAGVETCNGEDDDCDGLTDDDDTAVTGTTTWYLDYDGDGYGGGTITADACDRPAGYAVDASDCDDLDVGSNPGATELCDGADNDCDGSVDEADAADAVTWYADADGDGYGDAARDTDACAQPTGHVDDDRDCDDRDAAINPGASELCNGFDDDCDGLVDDDDPGVSGLSTWYADVDADGYGDATAALVACFQPSGYVADDSDCSDRDPGSNPGATELCDGADNDCDGTVDEGSAADAATWYADDDADGYGDLGSSTTACSQPSGHVADATDCDDRDDDINPGADELCNGFDDDCDGASDESDATDAGDWYADADADGYGDAASSTPACSQPSGHVADDSDCDDGDPSVNPAASEQCNSVDDDCDGAVDESDALDASTWYADVDGDGYGDAASSDRDCDAISGYVADATDCDDTDAAVYPGAAEYCDGIDSDCDGTADESDASDVRTWYADADGDYYGDPSSTFLACSAPSGHVADGSDCDDGDASVHPGATELCDGHDDDCDGTVDESDAADASTWYRDADSDSYGDSGATMVACDQPSGYAASGTDCDDGDSAINPGATESCNGYDDDCDGLVDDDDSGVSGVGTWYADADSDGYGSTVSSTTACTVPSGYLGDSSDCDDGDSAVYPGAAELCNGYDDDCDGLVDDDDGDLTEWSTWYLDADGDGYGDASDSMESCEQPSGYVADATDCDDDDPSVGVCYCGDGVVDPGEEADPDPGYSYISLDSTCRWDFSGIHQLYCNGSCTWAGSSSCDQADADILCKLLMDNPASTAISWTATTALAEPGFSCPGYGTTINTDRGVSVSVWYQDSSILGNHGPGAVVAYPVCTNP